jgi:hypothetical protein
MNLWADIILEHPKLLNKIPKDVVLLNWDYNVDGERIRRTKKIADAGFSFMVCPGTSSWNTHGTRLANAIGNVTQFAEQGLKYGAEGLLNTDWGDNGHRNFLGVSLHGFAHGAANAWNSKSVNNKTFTEKFCSHLFGPVGKKLAKAVRILGSTYLTCGAPYHNECALFYALVEPIEKSKAFNPSRIDATGTTGLKKIVSQLSDTSIWPQPSKGIAEFESLALRELKVAAEMDCTAAQKALAAKQIRNGKSVPAVQLKNIVSKIRCISDKFTELWMVRNKSSRLQDNLKLFRQVEKECLKLAKL